jgi:hypothetical protein
LKSMAGQEQTDVTERLRRAEHLRDAIAQRAQERGDSPAEVARVLDMSVGHWYRLKKEPHRLGRLTLERLDSVARYVAWTRPQVMVAVGWLRQSELDEAISAQGAVRAALERLERSGVASGVTTPIAKAAADHRLLLARLLLAAEGAAVAKNA